MTESFNEDINSSNDANINNFLLIKNALNEIEDSNFDNAIELTNKGIEKYPNYPALLFLHAKALLGKDRNREAEETVRNGAELLGCEPTLEYYLKLIPPAEEETDQVSEPEQDDVNLTELADQLSSAKMDILHGQDETANVGIDAQPIPPGRSLVSETLARIYFSQENYKEAKEIYETLIEIQPEREDYYKRKLSEINTKMGIPS
ncbi:MAG: tetratricopeptide repeat protein [Bacteroidota bacterium]